MARTIEHSSWTDGTHYVFQEQTGRWWYVVDDGDRIGPLSCQEACRLFNICVAKYEIQE